MSEMVKLRVGGVPEHFNWPWHRAMQLGEFKEQGIDIEWTDYPGGTGAMTADLKKRSIDVAILLTEGAVKGISTGNGFKIAQEYVKSPLIWGVHTAAHNPAQTADELSGQRFAISRKGSGSHLMAFVDAEKRRWDLSALKFHEVGSLDGAIESLKNDESGIFLWEKFTTKPFVDKGDLKRVGECPTPWPCFVVAVRNETLINHEEEVLKMLEVINASCKAVMDDAQSAVVIADKYNLEVSDAKEWFAQTVWNTKVEVSKKSLQEVIDTLIDLKVLEEHSKPEKICAGFTHLD